MARPRKKLTTDQRRVKGSGTISHDKRRGWFAQVSRIEGGRRVRRTSKYFKTKAEAQRALDELERDEVQNSLSRETVGGIVRAYIDRKDQARAATTTQRYNGLAKNLASIKDARAESLTVAKLDSLRTQLRENGLSPTTVFHVHSLLSASFKWATRKGLIKNDPFVKLAIEKPKRAKSDATALTVADARTFIDQLYRTRYANALMFLLFTGMRRGEVCGLRRSSLDLKRGIVLVRESRFQIIGEVGQKSTKSGQVREVPLSDPARLALAAEDERQVKLREVAGDAWEGSDFVFTDDFGRPLAPLAFTNAFRVVATAAKFYDGPHRYSLHSLRHTAATWMLAAGMEIHAVQKVLGHTEASTTTNVYGHVVSGRTRAAVNAISDMLGPVNLDAVRARKANKKGKNADQRTA